MIPERVFHQILALGEAWHVTTVDYLEAERKVTIRVEETLQLWASQACPHCGQRQVSGYDHAPERHWRHLNVCQLESEITCALPRGQCRYCQKVLTVRAPWEGRSPRCPQEFEALALTLMWEMPGAKAGEILGATDQMLWRMLFAHVDAAWAGLSWENVIWVGADEMNRRKGHNYLTVFVDLEAKRVLLAVEGKDASVWERFAAELGRHNGHPKAITQVAIDMSPAYVKGVKENLGNAGIVFDKFHVVNQVVDAVDEVRRAETRQDAEARAHLEKTCWLWRKNPEGWTEREALRWEQLKDKPLVPGLAVCDAVGAATGVCRGDGESSEAPPRELVSVGARGGGSLDQWLVGADAQSRRHGGAPLGRHPRSLESRPDDGVSGRAQQSVLGDPAQSPRLLYHRVSDRHALLRGRQAGDTLLWLIPITNVEEPDLFGDLAPSLDHARSRPLQILGEQHDQRRCGPMRRIRTEAGSDAAILCV